MAKTKATAERPILTVERRTEIGTRPTERLRRDGWIPGVVYGEGLKTLAIRVPERALIHLLHSKAGEHALVTLKIEDGARWEKPALLKEVQHHAVSGQVLHVDFHAIALTEEIKVKIPVVLKGEPVGVKVDGGILEHFLREIEVECLPTEIPAGIEYDVSALKIGDSVHVKDLPAPKAAKIIHDPESAVASVQAPREEKEEAPAEAAAEPEVIREKKEEGEEGGAPGEKRAPEKGEKAEKAAEKGEKKDKADTPG